MYFCIGNIPSKTHVSSTVNFTKIMDPALFPPRNCTFIIQI